MKTGLPALSVIGGAAAFGASGVVLALMGAGMPFLAAALIAAACTGLLLYGVGRVLPDQPLESPPQPPALDLESRVRLLEESSAHLRHDLRGVLSPALMMADRLLKNEDPAIRRAGQAVVRSVERATTLLAENKRQIAAAAGQAEMEEAGSLPRSPVGESAAQGP
jgi:hypothetical protein